LVYPRSWQLSPPFWWQDALKFLAPLGHGQHLVGLQLPDAPGNCSNLLFIELRSRSDFTHFKTGLAQLLVDLGGAINHFRSDPLCGLLLLRTWGCGPLGSEGLWRAGPTVPGIFRPRSAPLPFG
jgi:hypothetical protein